MLHGYQPKTKKANWTSLPGVTPAKGGLALNRPKPRVRRPRYIRHLSPNRRAENAEDARRLDLWWPLNRQCFLYPDHFASDRHHVAGRAGKLLLLVRLWVPLSRKAHDWVEQHRPLARIIGLLCREGQWNSVPDEHSLEVIEYRQAVYRFWCGLDEQPRKPGPLVSSIEAQEIKREVINAFAAVRASL